MPRRDNTNQSKKPADTAFKQQRLPAWQPILSPPWVISCFFLVALVFIPIGVLVILASNQVVEIEQRYDTLKLGTNNKFDYILNNQQYASTGRGRTFVRWVDMGVVQEDMEPPIYVYYKLSNFYQNHRRYARSRSDAQLAGDEVKFSSISDCAPMRYPGEIASDSKKNLPLTELYAPCGLIAWSMFNDSFALYRGTTPTASCTEGNLADCELLCGADFSQKPTVGTLGKCTKDGIAWASDKDKKFKQPAAPYIQSSDTTPNFYWNEGMFNTTPGLWREGHVIPIQTDEDFMVWMRTASLPTFRKLWRILPDESSGGIAKLKKGEHLWLRVVDRFNTDDFKGEKAFVLSTTTWIGGKNYFLGIAYLVVGCICFLLAIVFVIKHLTSRNSAAQNTMAQG